MAIMTAQQYTFHCRFTTDARLPGYLGSTLRGALGWAMKKTSCALGRQSCESCLLHAQCAYAWIFESERYHTGDGHIINARPHPFVLQPEVEEAGPRKCGDELCFSLVLFGRGNDYLPHIVQAIRLMGESGIGSGRRQGLGRFDLDKIVSGNEVCYDRKTEALNQVKSKETIGLDNPTDKSMSSICVTLQTPLRLKRKNRLLLELPFVELVRACLRRIAALEDAYGPGEPDLDYPGLIRRAKEVKRTRDTIHWKKLYRWSNRQKKKVSLGGLVGSCVYQGELDEFLPLLRYAERVNIGKQTVFGLGRMELTEA